MKKLVLALSAVAAFSAPALAADMAAKAPPMRAAPVAYAPSWTGFWVSGGFGYGLYDIDRSVVSSTLPLTVFDTGHDNAGRGWLGKVGAGADYQFAGPFGNWVVGIFGDAQWTGIKGNSSFTCPGGCSGPDGFNGSQKLDSTWAVGGRIGYVALPGLLTYWNGGWTEAHFSGVNYFDASGLLPTPVVSLGSRTPGGWFLGGGTEYAVTQLPGLFWKSEYRFADYGTQTNGQICTVEAGSGCGGVGFIHSIDRSHPYVQTITTELVYRFNWGGPVVAKY